MTTTAKQTARNNASLRRVKAAMNGPIFKRVADAYNAAGPEAARAELAVFFDQGPEGFAAVSRIFDGA